MSPTNPLTAFARPPDGTFQVEASFTLEPTLTDVEGEPKFVAKCNLHFSVSGKQADAPWEFITQANDLSEEALQDMYREALQTIRDIRDHQLMEHYHKKYRTGLVNMKLERAFGEVLQAITEKVEQYICREPEPQADPLDTVDFYGVSVPQA